MATDAISASPGAPYPVTYDVQYPESLSRWKIFVKWLLGIPHFIVLYLLGIVSALVTLIAFFAILFTKKYPESMFRFNVGVHRWQHNLGAYIWLLRDEYPPFSMDAGKYPVVFDVQYPPQLSRWLIFVKWLLVIPAAVTGLVVLLVAYLATLIAWFAILFTGRYPLGIFDFVVGALRWNARVNSYSNLMTDRYPPFSMQP